MRFAVATVLRIVGVFYIVVSIFFADWSGNHQISWSGVILGAALLVIAHAVARFRRPPAGGSGTQ